MTAPGNPVSYTLSVTTTPYLPTVLTAIALRVPKFTVEDDRAGNTGGWLIRIVDLPHEVSLDLLEKCPEHMVSIYSIEKSPAMGLQ